MKKAILSASGAFISFLCVIVLLTAFAKSDEALFAILAVIFAFLAIGFITYGIADTKMADKLSNLYGEEVNHE